MVEIDCYPTISGGNWKRLLGRRGWFMGLSLAGDVVKHTISSSIICGESFDSEWSYRASLHEKNNHRNKTSLIRAPFLSPKTALACNSTPEIRTLSFVPLVSWLEEFHCISSKPSEAPNIGALSPSSSPSPSRGRDERRWERSLGSIGPAPDPVAMAPDRNLDSCKQTQRRT